MVITSLTSASGTPDYTTSLYSLPKKCSTYDFLCESCLQNKALGFSKKSVSIFSVSGAASSHRVSWRTRWSVRSMADGNRSDIPVRSTNGETRLIGELQAFLSRLRSRVTELRKGLLMKILSFLVGFYCATAFATVIGQTGDWDILSAGLAVFVVEAIGALMYRASFKLIDRFRGWIAVVNYWKAGLSLGLFLDAFKY